MIIHGVFTNLQEFDTLVEQIRFRRAETLGRRLPYREEYYRGQLDSCWPIIPAISRCLKIGDQVRAEEADIMNHFQKEIVAQNYQHIFSLPFSN